MSQKVSDYTEMVASEITTPASVAVHVIDMQSTNTTRWMDFAELHKASVWNITTSLPGSGSDAGLYIVTTGANRGLYVSNGVETYELTRFDEDASL
jgi:hypothetical protein